LHHLLLISPSKLKTNSFIIYKKIKKEKQKREKTKK